MKIGAITPGEMIFLHEILTLKNTSAVKSSVQQSQVTDQRLSKILEQDIAMTKQQLQDIRNLLTLTHTVT
jgi:similar to spore coat protein